MSVHVTIVNGPVPPASSPMIAGAGEAGAVVTFEGVVRKLEQGRELLALDYEVYEPMASLQLNRLASDMLAKHTLIALHVAHSQGRVAVGQASLRVTITAAHRGEALRAMTEFLDLLKRDVPIWKSPVFADGSTTTR